MWRTTGNTQVAYPKPNKMSYINVPGQVPLLDITVGGLLNEITDLYPTSSAVVAYHPVEVRRNYEQLKTEVNNLASGFLQLGLKKGDRVGIWGPSSYEWYLTFLATLKAGLVSVHINPSYDSNEVSYCINKVGVKCVVVLDLAPGSTYKKTILEICPELQKGEQEHPVISSMVPTLTTLVTASLTDTRGGHTLQDVMKWGSHPYALDVLKDAETLVQFDDRCSIQFTSGTTGNPKAVMLTHHNLVNDSYFFSRRFGYSEKDKLCLPLSMFHCFGCVVGALAAVHSGAAVVIPSLSFSPELTVEAVSKDRCTVIYGTPNMHIEILHAPGFEDKDVTSLKLAVTGGAVCPEELIRKMKTKYTVESVKSSYGLTETSPTFFQTLAQDSDQLCAETVGYPLEHLEVKIVDANGQLVQVGDLGELCVRGFVVMQGYWGDPDKTDEVIDQSRWFHTGDLSVMLETGHTRIVGRMKDVIVKDGQDIYPREIEDIFHTHPSVQEAQVFSIPDSKMGEEVCAWIKLKSQTFLNEEELILFCQDQMGNFKAPRHIRFVKTFPTTVSGKVQKYKMREVMVKELFCVNDRKFSLCTALSIPIEICT